MPIGPCSGHCILKCLLSPDVRQLATASADKTVKLWNLDGFVLDRTLTGGPAAPEARPPTALMIDHPKGPLDLHGG